MSFYDTFTLYVGFDCVYFGWEFDPLGGVIWVCRGGVCLYMAFTVEIDVFSYVACRDHLGKWVRANVICS